LNPDQPLDNIRVVLVETSHPGNLGSAARAMKTMGLSRLVLVAPRCAIDDQALALASGAQDVLIGARTCDNLDEALQGVVLAAACTSRRRDLPHPAYTPRQAAPELLRHARVAEVALVFGSETYGLANEQLMRCRWLLNIPANPDYMSLNLAAAVQVCAYELRSLLDDSIMPLPDFMPARHEEIEAFYAALEETLVAIGFHNPGQPKRLLPRLRRFFARAGLEREELAIWRGIVSAIRNPKIRPD
jgi:tRNA/rRNA methyltransferase